MIWLWIYLACAVVALAWMLNSVASAVSVGAVSFDFTKAPEASMLLFVQAVGTALLWPLSAPLLLRLTRRIREGDVAPMELSESVRNPDGSVEAFVDKAVTSCDSCGEREAQIITIPGGWCSAPSEWLVREDQPMVCSVDCALDYDSDELAEMSDMMQRMQGAGDCVAFTRKDGTEVARFAINFPAIGEDSAHKLYLAMMRAMLYSEVFDPPSNGDGPCQPGP